MHITLVLGCFRTVLREAGCSDEQPREQEAAAAQAVPSCRPQPGASRAPAGSRTLLTPSGTSEVAGAGPGGSPWSTEGWAWMQVPRAGLAAAPSALDALLRRRVFFLFNVSPLNLRWTMESFQHSEYNELVSAAPEFVSRLETQPAGSTLGPASSTKNNGKAGEGRAERQHPALGDSPASGASQSSLVLHVERITASRPSF